MPCQDYRDNSYEDTTKIDKLTRMLCYLCGSCQPKLIKDNPELSLWWKEHQEQDRKRIASELAEEERKTLKRVALSKLTNEEKKALGIKE